MAAPAMSVAAAKATLPYSALIATGRAVASGLKKDMEAAGVTVYTTGELLEAIREAGDVGH